MDHITIPSLIFVSFPEGIIAAVLGLLAIGKFNYLKEKTSFIRIVIFAIIYALAGYFIRRIAVNVVENSLIYLILICLSFIFIIRLKFYESITATLLGTYVLLFIIQTISILPVLALAKISLNDAYISDLTRFLIVVPERLLEILAIYLSLRFKIKIFDLENANIKRKEYFIQLFVYIVSIGTLIFVALIMANTLFFKSGSFMNSTITLLLRLNIYLSLFVTIILTLAIRSIKDHYKNKSNMSNIELMQSLDYLSDLIQKKDYAEAKDVVDNLKSYIKSGRS